MPILSSSHTTIRKTMGVQDSHPSAVRQGYLSESCFLSSKSWHLASNIWKPQAQWPAFITTFVIRLDIGQSQRLTLAQVSEVATIQFRILSISMASQSLENRSRDNDNHANLWVGLYKLASGIRANIVQVWSSPGDSLRIWWTFEWQEW